VVENAQSALLETSGLKPTLRRATLSGIADMPVYEIPWATQGDAGRARIKRLPRSQPGAANSRHHAASEKV